MLNTLPTHFFLIAVHCRFFFFTDKRYINAPQECHGFTWARGWVRICLYLITKFSIKFQLNCLMIVQFRPKENCFFSTAENTQAIAQPVLGFIVPSYSACTASASERFTNQNKDVARKFPLSQWSVICISVTSCSKLNRTLSSPCAPSAEVPASHLQAAML